MQGSWKLDDWRGSGRRIAVCVVVAGIHLGLVMLLLRAPVPSRAQPVGATRARDMLRIRFLPSVLPRPARMPPPIFLPRAPQRMVHRATNVVIVATTIAAAPATAYTSTPVEPRDETPGQSATYIAGGGFLDRAATGAAADNIHLPGSGQPIVKGLQMVDPRSQGVGGVVRAVQTLFGVADPHCINVEVWRGMSVREMLDRHMSPDQVEKTAEKYHCGPG